MPAEFVLTARVARKGLYPSVILSDMQWDRVITALLKRETQLDQRLADNITKQVETTRARHDRRS